MRKDPLFTMPGIGAEGFIYPSAILPYTLPVQKNKWAGVQEERKRQEHEKLYGRKLLGMVIPKIGERPIDKMNLLQQLIQKHQGPATPSVISIDKPFESGSLALSQIGTIVPDGVYHEKKEPYVVPEAGNTLIYNDKSFFFNLNHNSEYSKIFSSQTLSY
ncbi:hypothetical protein [Bartonella taylorii]|uniref:hypothetical protein n=1 Tax=Bartonella taylorii TaxID=33046 RepID=UPI001ABAB2F0|nr:hypothetical protein [Bartonella taylorii]